ncbi:uncharacterized protein ARMOST_12311 [Armillaria ostoyae]|uniref:Uncharacterized protein n=1 Tax=Armillaria ostoyae TaxID=47428 RepID=A0A284RJJ0_ARMOS|nr:uncharacterized protein ARMOST_12311 [Armillaria ostoyae]
MTPDEISILVAGLIGGSALLSLLVALLVLTYAEQLRRIFRIRPLAPINPALPGHYVLPYLEPRPLVEPVGQIHAPAPQRRATFAATSSDEHLPPRNVTPGPSNVPRTPPPTYNPSETEEYGRFLRSIFRSTTPDDLPLITIPDSPETPVRALIPEDLNPETPRTPSPLRRQRLSGTLHTGGIRIGTPAHLCPLPDSDDESNSDSASSNYGGNEPVAEREDDDPLNPNGSDYEHGSSAASTSSSEADTKDLRTGSEWATTSRPSEVPAFLDEDERQQSAQEFTPIDSERNSPHPPAVSSWMLDPEPTQSNELSPTYYSHSHSHRETDPIWMAPPDFDNFNQDEETFGGWADEEDYEETGDYRDYTPAPINDGDY